MNAFHLEERDLEYVVDAVAPQFEDRPKLKRLIVEDESFRQGILGSQEVYSRIMEEEALELKISPRLFFEVLLRRARQELEQASHTEERVGAHHVPVFDAPDVARLLQNPRVVDYLARLLVSFMRIQSYTITMRVRPGIWRKMRLSDLDIHTLQRLSRMVDEPERFDYYQRIGDVSLFLLGLFPDSLAPGRAETESADLPLPLGEQSAEEYQREGKRHFRLAAQHRRAQGTDLADLLWTLHENFELAHKPLNYLAYRYLPFQRKRLFGVN